jgi:hypothetical protein
MEKLGMEAHEYIEHAMVTSSLERAQSKLKKLVREELPADSFAEWKAVHLKR